jgi:hypothetical protein
VSLQSHVPYLSVDDICKTELLNNAILQTQLSDIVGFSIDRYTDVKKIRNTIFTDEQRMIEYSFAMQQHCMKILNNIDISKCIIEIPIVNHIHECVIDYMKTANHLFNIMITDEIAERRLKIRNPTLTEFELASFMSHRANSSTFLRKHSMTNVTNIHNYTAESIQPHVNLIMRIMNEK